MIILWIFLPVFVSVIIACAIWVWRGHRPAQPVSDGECRTVARGMTIAGVHPVCQRKTGHKGLHNWDGGELGGASWSP